MVNIKKGLIKCDDLILYYQKSKRGIRIMAHDRYCGRDYSEDELWIDKDFIDIKVLCRENDNYCYTLLKEPSGKGCIMELVNHQVIHENFMYDSYKKVAKRFLPNFQKDVVVVFSNEKTKTFAVFSLFEKKYIFSLYQYAHIKEMQYGVILDYKTAVDYNGYVTDLSDYECIDDGRIFYNKEKDKYLLLLNEEGELFYEPVKDKNDESILVVELDYRTYRLNTKTEEIECIINDEIPLSYSQHEWDEFNDVAFEGHSRLELGID